jgi:LPXTG-motif cell wall-anchored protein
MLAAAALVGGTLLVTGPVSAAGSGPTSCSACGAGEVIFGSSFAGVYNVPVAGGGVVRGYCITPGGFYPDSTHDAAGSYPVANAAVWAEFINLSDPSSDTDQAGVGARIQRDLFGQGDFSAISSAAQARSDALWAQATRLAGPWATHVVYYSNQTVSVSVTAASGALVPGATVDLGWANSTGPATVNTGNGGSVTVPFTPRFGAPGKVTATGRRIGPLGLLRWTAELGSEQDVTSMSGPVDAAPDSDTWTVVKPSLVTIIKQDADTGATVPGAVIGFSDTATGTPFAQVTTQATPVPVPGLDNRAGQRVYYRELASPTGYLADAASGSFVVGQDGGTISLAMKDSAATPSCISQATASYTTGQDIVFGVPGGPVGDGVTCAGLPPNNPAFEVQEQLLSVPAPASGRCRDVPSATWASARVVGTGTISMPASPATGTGPYSVTGSLTPPLSVPAGATGCLGWRGTATPWPGAAALRLDPVPAEQVTLVVVRLATRVQQQLVRPGGLLVDLVDVIGLPPGLPGPFPATADVRSLPAGPHGCAGLGPAQFARVAPYRSVPFSVDHGNGTYRVQITVPATADRCLNFTERFTRPLWPGGPTPSAEVGAASETSLLDHPMASGGGGGRNHGLPNTGANVDLGVVLALLLLGLGGLFALAGRRRRRSSTTANSS